MRTGDPTSVCAGENEMMLVTFDIVPYPDGRGAQLKLKALAGYGDTFWAVVVDGKVISVVFLAEGIEISTEVIWQLGRTNHVVSASPLGNWPDAADIDPTADQFDFESDKGKSAIVQFEAVPESTEAFNDIAQISAITLSGMRRYTNCRSTEKSTQGRLDLTISTSGADHTVALSLAGRVMMQGTRTGNGLVTLDEANDSGASATLTLTHSADLALAAGAFVNIRWPASYQVHFALTTTISFPRIAELLLNDDGRANIFQAVFNDQPVGTYDYVIRAVSDTGIVGTNVAVMGTLVIPGRPAPPGDLAYVSGDNTATIISWPASVTAGASYRIYDSELDGPVDTLTIEGTEPAGAGTISHTMSAIGAAAGKRRIMVVAVLGGIEDGTRREIVIEYDAAGTVITARPNIPGFELKSLAGRGMTVSYEYFVGAEKASPTDAQLFVFAEGTAPVYTTPDATQAIPALGAGSLGGLQTVRSGMLVFTVPADGWYNFIVRAATGVGVQSPNLDLAGPVFLSLAVPAEPINDEGVVIS